MEPKWIDHINGVRAAELEWVLERHRRQFDGKDLLEIGSGSGVQLRILSSICRSSIGLEISGSWYRDHRIAAMLEFDGRKIPFPDASFDVIFSSHVLQYLSEEQGLYEEMRRVLRPSGIAIHVVPSITWKIWTSLFHYPAKALLLTRNGLAMPVGAMGSEQAERVASVWRPKRLINRVLLHRHGTRGNWFTEHFMFFSSGWRRTLARHGWVTELINPMGLWYTGHLLAGPALSLCNRKRLARFLGSSALTILARPT